MDVEQADELIRGIASDLHALRTFVESGGTEEADGQWLGLLLECLGFALALAGAVVGGWKYLDARRRELAWKRTEFIFGQSRALQDDKAIARAISVLSAADKDSKIQAIFDDQSSWPEAERARYRESFVRLCDLLEHLAYAFEQAGSITLEEISLFGWYYRKISSSAILADFCRREGFPEIVNIAPKVQKFHEARYGPSEPGG